MNEASWRPLGEIDQSAVDRFWQRFTAATDSYSSAVYAEAFQFGDHRALADKLLDIVVHGPKRATADTVARLEAAGGKLPAAGDLWVACDGHGAPRLVIETTDVRVGPLSSVDSQFAWDEGEGDRSREYWLQAHTECFTRSYEHLGIDIHPDIAVIFERFDLVYVE